MHKHTGVITTVTLACVGCQISLKTVSALASKRTQPTLLYFVTMNYLITDYNRSHNDETIMSYDKCILCKSAVARRVLEKTVS